MTQRNTMTRTIMAVETNYGDGGTGDPIVVYFNSNTLKATKPENQTGTIRGDVNPVAPYSGLLEVSGDITVPVDTEVFKYLLRQTFNKVTSTGPSSYLYNHKFVVDKSERLKSFILEKGYLDIDKYFKYSGCKINSMSIDFNAGGEELLATFNIMGKDETISSASYDETPYIASAADIFANRFDHIECSVSEGGSASSIVESVSVNYSNNLDLIYCIGGAGKVTQNNMSNVSVSGTITALFNDTTILEKAKNKTESSLVLTLTKGSHTITITLPEVIYTQTSPEITSNDGSTRVTMDFVGYYDNGADKSCLTVELKSDSAFNDAP